MRWVSAIVSTTLVAGLAAGGTYLAKQKLAPAAAAINFRTYAMFRDASKIAVGSPVMIAGVHVGEVTAIAIEGSLARVDLGLRADYALPFDSWATRRDNSLFGDAYVEIIPGGSSDRLAVGAGQMLKAGEPISRVVEGASTDRVLRAIERSLPRVEQSVQAFGSASQQARSAVIGDYFDKFTAVVSWLDGGGVSTPLTRIDTALTALEQSTERAARALRGGGDSFDRKLAAIDSAIAKTRGKIAVAKSEISNSLQAAQLRVATSDDSLARVAQALRGNRENPGRLAQLLDDDGLHENLLDAAANTNATLSSVASLRTAVGLRGEYDILGGRTRIIASAFVAVRNDKFYLAEATVRPQGKLESKLEIEPDGTFTRKLRLRDQFLLTAQIGKRFGAVSVRGGIKESALGIGIDSRFASGRLVISADLFGTQLSGRPNLRVSAAAAVFRGLYLLAGIDQALASRGSLRIGDWTSEVPDRFGSLQVGRDVFVGGYVMFTDDQLISLMTFYGSLIVGLI